MALLLYRTSFLQTGLRSIYPVSNHIRCSYLTIQSQYASRYGPKYSRSTRHFPTVSLEPNRHHPLHADKDMYILDLPSWLTAPTILSIKWLSRLCCVEAHRYKTNDSKPYRVVAIMPRYAMQVKRPLRCIYPPRLYFEFRRSSPCSWTSTCDAQARHQSTLPVPGTSWTCPQALSGVERMTRTYRPPKKSDMYQTCERLRRKNRKVKKKWLKRKNVPRHLDRFQSSISGELHRLVFRFCHAKLTTK